MGSYGLSNKLTFYPSIPLYSYATGNLKVFSNNANSVDDITATSMITLEPSKWHKLNVQSGEYLEYRDRLDRQSDFFMVLGHDFEYTNQSLSLQLDGSSVSTTTIVNDCLNNTPSYNGWSLSSLNMEGIDRKKIIFDSTTEQIRVGSILYGKSWTAPINVNVGQSYSVNYNSKQQKTISGKTLSTLNYDKVQNWGNLPAWELLAEADNTDLYQFGYQDYLGNQRTGVRSWNVNFSMLNDSDILSQNQMVTSNGWTQDSADNYYTSNNESTYNNQNSNDFMTSVYKYTMGSHLPVVVNISDSKNADQWAIVRITNMTMKESNPKFIDISMTLEEQV
tara:strand:- start:156 stop:1160 length:1005 start_codon:yes stop_codon:yes gene_type:complete